MENSTNIGEIIKSTRGNDLLLFSNFTYGKLHESKNASVRWRCTVRTCNAKVYTSIENIVEIVEIVNEHNGHDQPSIDTKPKKETCMSTNHQHHMKKQRIMLEINQKCSKCDVKMFMFVLKCTGCSLMYHDKKCWIKSNESTSTWSVVEVTKCASPTDRGSTIGSGEYAMATTQMIFKPQQSHECLIELVFNRGYDESRLCDRISRVLQLCSHDGHTAGGGGVPNTALAMKIFVRVQPDYGPLDLVPRPTTACLFRCLNLFVHDAAEVYRVLGRVPHVLRYKTKAARDRLARLQRASAMCAVDAAGPSKKVRPAAASFGEYRDKVAARRRNAHDIRSAYGMAMRPCALYGGELI